METRRYTVAALLLMLAGLGCKGKHNRVTVQNEEPDPGPRMLSIVPMNDARAGVQLLNGFYSIENDSWRWTGRRFSVLLRTPLASAQRGATLTFSFTVPDLVVQKLRNITLSASVNGTTLSSADYNKSGPFVFSADVPASLLTADTVKVDFALDKSLPPEIDKRELGIIASSVGISSR